MSSIEIRMTADGADLECEWGVFRNSDANVRKRIDRLILIPPEHAKHMLAMAPVGPLPHRSGGTSTATMVNGRIRIRLNYGVGHWDWDLYEAHWWDGEDMPIMVGKWPD
jgi:hypothetical protein